MRLNNSRIFFVFKTVFCIVFGVFSRDCKNSLLAIQHHTRAHSSTRSWGTQSSKSNISGKVPSHALITMSVAGGAPGTVRRKNLNENGRRALIDELLAGSKQGKLAHGDMKRVAEQFGCSPKQVAAVWKLYKEQKDAGIASPNLRNKRVAKSGPKGHNWEELREKLRHIPLKNRTTQRAVAAYLGIPHTTLTRNLQKLGLHASRRFLKPRLTDAGKAAREAWAAAHSE